MQKSKFEIEYTESQIEKLNQSLNQILIENSNKKSSVKLLQQCLIDNQIRFEAEKSFVDLPRHRFDFYLYDFNLIIEYDGIQHYQPVDYFGGVNSFIDRRNKDVEKDKYCKNNKINLIRMNFNMTMQDIITYLIQSLKLIIIEKSLLNHSIEIGCDYQLKDIIVDDYGTIDKTIIKQNIDENIIKSYYEDKNDDIIYLSEDYSDYLKYYKAYYGENSNLTFLEFKDYVADYFKESRMLSKKPVKYKKGYSFTLTNISLNKNEESQESIAEQLNNADPVAKFVEYLEDNDIFKYPIIVPNLMYQAYSDFNYINNPGSTVMSNRLFNSKFTAILKEKGYTLSPIKKRFSNLNMLVFNPHLLKTRSELLNDTAYSRYSKNLDSNTTQIFYIKQSMLDDYAGDIKLYFKEVNDLINNLAIAKLIENKEFEIKSIGDEILFVAIVYHQFKNSNVNIYNKLIQVSDTYIIDLISAKDDERTELIEKYLSI